MRLLSAQIQNYRAHKNSTIEFKDSLVLIHGPNESGKSTLAEAIHCALFLKAKGSTELHAAMESDHGGEPSVRLEFEAKGTRHTLEKTFGAKGSTKLESQGEATLTGDSAEAQLATLLAVDGAVGGRGAASALPKRWAHLWVWQGQSNRSPVETIEESETQLREKLQARTGQDVISSPLDGRVIEQLQAIVADSTTSTGRVKAGSDLDKADKALEAARTQLADKQAQLLELNQAATAYEQASQDLERYDKSLKEAGSRLKEIGQQLNTVRDHREALKAKQQERDSIQKELKALKGADSGIRRIESELNEAQKAAAPAKLDLATAEAELASKQAELEKATQARELAAEKLTEARALADACQANMGVLRERRNIEELVNKQKKITSLRTEADEIRKQLAPLENFTTKAIAKLRKLSNDTDQKNARLEAYALGLQVKSTDLEISLEGKPLKQGESRTLTRPAELKIGPNTVIQLTPGGADDLQTAQSEHEAAKDLLSNTLKNLGSASILEAETSLHTREGLELNRKNITEKLDELDADEIEEALRQASDSLAIYKSRRETALSGITAQLKLSDDLKTSETLESETNASLKTAETAAKDAGSTEKALRTSHGKAKTQRDRIKTEQDKLAQIEQSLAAELKVRLTQSGAAAQRTKAINEQQASLEQVLEAEKVETKALQSLGADQLDLDRERLEKSKINDQRNREDARDRKVAAQTQLQSSGNSDPQREAQEAQANCDRLEQRLAALTRQSEVRTQLLERLKAARKATTGQLTQPLEEAVSPYLQFLFGGSRARLHWAEDGSRLESFEIDRTQNQSGRYSFDQLSHGTREQVALALRLAMAELLAADHDGCLPVVLDDAFTHADKNRIEKLKSLLYRASQNGLQIILLSCHPENYSGLSASEVGLN